MSNTGISFRMTSIEGWVLEYFVGDVKVTDCLYKANLATMDQVIAINRIYRWGDLDIRIRQATEQDWERMRNEGLLYVDLDPACRDWMLQTSFEDNWWPWIYRDTSLSEILKLARGKADGICSVFFRPATLEEIVSEEADQREFELERLKGIRRAQLVGLFLQIVLTSIFVYLGLRLLPAHGIIGLCLLSLAGISALNLAMSRGCVLSSMGTRRSTPSNDGPCRVKT